MAGESFELFNVDKLDADTRALPLVHIAIVRVERRLTVAAGKGGGGVQVQKLCDPPTMFLPILSRDEHISAVRMRLNGNQNALSNTGANEDESRGDLPRTPRGFL